MKKPERVIVLLFAHRAILEWHEEIALQQCFKVLRNHTIRLVCPDGMDVGQFRTVEPTLEIDYISPKWLNSLRSYNRLKILPFLYERYSDFEFILTYELDAFVFKDELEYWCEQEWDYVGGPWFEGHVEAVADSRPISGGNSGFSLRRTSTMLRVLNTFKLIRPAAEIFGEWKAATKLSPRAVWWLFRNLTWRNCFHHRFNGFTDNEDMFWAFAGARIEGFRLAPYEVARRFSFDCNPERLFSETGKQLPFGAHKWAGKDFGFWRPFIEAEGYAVPK